MSTGVTGFATLSLFRLTGAKIVVIAHNKLWPEGFPPSGMVATAQRQAQRFLWRQCIASTIVVSPAAQRQIQAVAGVPSESIHVFRPPRASLARSRRAIIHRERRDRTRKAQRTGAGWVAASLMALPSMVSSLSGKADKSGWICASMRQARECLRNIRYFAHSAHFMSRQGAISRRIARLDGCSQLRIMLAAKEANYRKSLHPRRGNVTFHSIFDISLT